MEMIENENKMIDITEIIENEIGSQRNILHDKICDSLPSVLQNLKSSKDNVKKSRDKKCKKIII